MAEFLEPIDMALRNKKKSEKMSGRNQKRKKKFSDKLGTKSEITKNLDECEDKIGAQPVIHGLFELWQHTV